MTFRTAVITAGMALGIAGLVLPGARAQQKTVWDGVYTEVQATRGQALYSAECASCHQTDLGGDGFAPGLAGGEFAAAWNDLPLADLFERTRQSMPPSNPGAVTPAEKADILAYMLKVNEFPAGEAELPSDVPGLKGIIYKSFKP